MKCLKQNRLFRLNGKVKADKESLRLNGDR